MTTEEIENRIIELDAIIAKLEEEDKQEEFLAAIDEQLELAQMLGITESLPRD